MSGPDSHQFGLIPDITPDEKARCLRLLERHGAMDCAGALFDEPRDTRTCARGHVFPSAVVSRSCPVCNKERKSA